MQKEILATLFLLFVAYSFVVMTDLTMAADYFIAGLASVLAAAQLTKTGVEE